ncbi:MAG: hypothetical protein AB7H90_03335 [Alphaproteobacteria bacterium]
MKTLDWTPNHPDTSGWKERHNLAVRQSRMMTSAEKLELETQIARAIHAWVYYAEAHRKRFESPIGEDYVLGPAWARWGFALHELLNGETGRLDCGTLSSIINDNLAEQGFKPEDGAP